MFNTFLCDLLNHCVEILPCDFYSRIRPQYVWHGGAFKETQAVFLVMDKIVISHWKHIFVGVIKNLTITSDVHNLVYFGPKTGAFKHCR